MQVVVDGLLTNYQIAGKGPRLLLLHGWADRLQTFDAIVGPLTDRYEVIRLDLPGFGQTEAPKSVWDLTDYARFTASFLNKINTTKPYAVIGHSNGGAVAIHGLGTGLMEADKLILLAASGVRDGQQGKLTLVKLIAKIGKVTTFWLPKATRQKLQKKLYGTIGSDMLVAPHLQETFKKTVRQDVQVDARGLMLPTLLIYGEADRATPIKDVGEVLHSCIADSKLVTIADADHFVHQKAAAEVVRHVEAFLA